MSRCVRVGAGLPKVFASLTEAALLAANPILLTMMEVKIQCDCGSKFKFDVEPVNGMMPGPVHCPTCNADATVAANVVISQNRQAALTAPVPPTGGIRLRVAGAAAPAETAESSPALSANRRLLERTT